MSEQQANLTYLKINGYEVLTTPDGATIKMGGPKYEMTAGNLRNYHTVTPEPGSVEVTVVLSKDLKLEYLHDLHDNQAGKITVSYETDNGFPGVLRNALIQDPLELTNGEVKLMFMGDAIQPRDAS